LESMAAIFCSGIRRMTGQKLRRWPVQIIAANWKRS